MTAALMRADLVIGDGRKAPLWRRLLHGLARYNSVRRLMMRLCQKPLATAGVIPRMRPAPWEAFFSLNPVKRPAVGGVPRTEAICMFFLVIENAGFTFSPICLS